MHVVIFGKRCIVGHLHTVVHGGTPVVGVLCSCMLYVCVYHMYMCSFVVNI